MRELLSHLIFIGGIGQLCVLIASAMVPFRLNWRAELKCLSRLHRQMYWVYGGYVVLSIIAFGLISLSNADTLASGTRLARSFCLYVALFWGIRLALQPVFDVTATFDGVVVETRVSRANRPVSVLHGDLRMGGPLPVMVKDQPTNNFPIRVACLHAAVRNVEQREDFAAAGRHVCSTGRRSAWCSMPGHHVLMVGGRLRFSYCIRVSWRPRERPPSRVYGSHSSADPKFHGNGSDSSRKRSRSSGLGNRQPGDLPNHR